MATVTPRLDRQSSRRRNWLKRFAVGTRVTWDRIVRGVELVTLPILFLGSAVLLTVVIGRSLSWERLASSIGNAKDRIAAENQVFSTLAQILGGSFVLAGLYFSGKSLIMSRQGQASDQFAKAIEQLGPSDLSKSMGGVQSLARLIRVPSPEYEAAIEILCGFVREETAVPEYRGRYPTKPRGDIQAALTALARRRRGFGRVRGENYGLDLRNSYLAGADFHRGNFDRANLDSAHLAGSNFFQTSLRRASVEFANIDRANFNQSDMQRTSFYMATGPGLHFGGPT